MAVRRLWLKAHLYVGLTIGIVLFVVAVSGAAVMFEESLDRALHAELSYVTAGAARLPLQDLVSRVEAALPGTELGAISFPERPTYAMQMSGRGKQGAVTVYVDQYTGRVIGTRTAAEREAGLARRLHLLHTRLLGGPIGESIVGAVAALTLFMAATGLVLWWPRKIVAVKPRASWKRVNFDLHNAFGFYASAVFLVVALTGIMIAFEGITDPLVSRLNAKTVPAAPRQSTILPGATPLPPDALAAAAEAALPGAFLKNLTLPNGGKSVIVAFMKYPEDRTPGGRSRVFLDQYSGRPLLVLDTRTAPLGTRIINLKRSAHTGDIFGAPTRALYFVASLLLAAQVVTGFVIWWNRERSGGNAPPGFGTRGF